MTLDQNQPGPIFLLAPDDPTAIFDFAMTFDGYEYCGSFEACAEAARLAERNSLDAVRNELFFAARASRHCGDERFVDVYRELLPLLIGHGFRPARGQVEN